MFAKALTGAFGLVVAVCADEPIEDLPEGQRHMVGILVEHGVDARQQGESFLPRRPRCEATRARSPALHTAE